VQRGANGGGAVHQDVDLDRRGDRTLQERQVGLHRIHGIDDVGPGLLEHHQQHRRFAVGQAEVAQVFNVFGNVTEIGNAHQIAVALLDHQRPVIAALIQHVVGLQAIGLIADRHRAFGQVDVGRLNHLPHLFQADAVAIEPVRIEFDAHRRQCRTAYRDIADASGLQQPLLKQGRGHVVHLATGRRIGGQAEDQDRRVGRVDLAIGRVAGQVARQTAAGGIDRCLHVPRRAIDVAIEVELQRDAGRPERTGRGHFGDPGDLPELTFQRCRHRRRHRTRVGTGQRRTHADGREIHFRQRRHRQQVERQYAKQRQPDRQQRGGDGALDKWRAKVHRARPRPPLDGAG